MNETLNTTPRTSMTLSQKVKSQFKGRLSQKNFILITLAMLSIFFVANLVVLVVAYWVLNYTVVSLLSFILGYIVIFSVFRIYILSIYVRRLHDINYSGTFALLTFIPVLNLLIPLILFFISGNNTDNKYGSPVNDILFQKSLFNSDSLKL